MFTKMFSVALVSSLVFIPVVGHAANENNNSMPGNGNNKAMHQQIQKDQEILGILIVLNNNEINAAKDALQKTENNDVKNYAELMVKDHSANLDQTMKISEKLDAKPLDSSKSENLKKKGEKALEKLAPLKGAEFDKAYMKDMVKDHREALDMIDHKLLKTVKDASLKDHLKATRQHVSHHLNEAKTIVKNLKS